MARANEQRRQQIAALSASVDRMNDSLRVLAARFASFQATANGEFDAMGRQMVAMQSLLGQTTRNVQDARAQLEALKEQGNAGADRSRLPARQRAAPAPAFRAPGRCSRRRRSSSTTAHTARREARSNSCSAHGPTRRKRPARSSTSASRTRMIGTQPRRTRYISSFIPSIRRVPRRRRRCTSMGFFSGTPTRRPKLASPSIESSETIPIPMKPEALGIF